VSVYRRGKTWWYSFVFCGQYIQESAKTKSKTVAKEAEKTRRRELEEGYNNIIPEDRNRRILTLAKAAEEYQEQYEARNSENASRYSEYCVKQLVEHLGNKMLIEITEHAVVAYQQARLREEAAGKTINEEVGALFRIMGGFGEAVRFKLKRAKKLKLAVREDVGRASTPEEEQGVVREAQASESPHIYTVVMIALNTGLRASEIRNLQWRQIDFFKQLLTVGKSKTAEGMGRTVPLNSELLKALIQHQIWYKANIDSPSGDHFVFARWTRQRYEATRPVRSFERAWNRVRREARYRPGFTI